MDTLGHCAIPLGRDTLNNYGWRILLVLSSLMLAGILATSLSGCSWGSSNAPVPTQVPASGAGNVSVPPQIPATGTGSVPLPPQVAASGTGGAIFAWLDGIISGNLYAQNVDADGNLAWGDEGKLICDETSNPKFPLIASDGLGGAFISWDSLKDGKSMLAHVDARGEILWQNDISNAGWWYSGVSDSSGGVIMVFCANAGPMSIHRANGDGRLLWGEDGIVISQAVSGLDLVGDGSGGAVVVWQEAVWQDNGGINTSINGQMINSEGQLLWTDKGLAVADSNTDQSDPQLLASEDGNFIIAWLKSSLKGGNYNNNDIYAQKISRQGERLWGNEGIPICTSTGNQCHQRLATDGEGGCIVVWDDDRNFSPRPRSEVYAQHVASDGTCLWNANGTLVWSRKYSSSDTFSYSPRDEQVISDNMGGAVFMWNNLNEGNLLAQRVDPNGNPLWSGEGVGVSDPPVNMGGPFRMVSDGKGGAIIGATVEKNQQRAQRISQAGELLWGKPGIAVVR